MLRIFHMLDPASCSLVVVVVVALLRSIRRSLLGPGLWGVSGILLSSSVASRDRLGLSS